MFTSIRRRDSCEKAAKQPATTTVAATERETPINLRTKSFLLCLKWAFNIDGNDDDDDDRAEYLSALKTASFGQTNFHQLRAETLTHCAILIQLIESDEVREMIFNDAAACKDFERYKWAILKEFASSFAEGNANWINAFIVNNSSESLQAH